MPEPADTPNVYEAMPGVFTRLPAQLGVQVELYYARFADAGHAQVTFERIAV